MYDVSSESSRRSSRRRASGRPADPRSIWDRPEPALRRPSHTRDGIARAAIEVADRDGFDALTMRNVAARLGAGTMTLYHYVRTKDELFGLVDNALMGELFVPADELPEGWRAGSREIARRTRDVFVRHPWVPEMPRNFDDGPNSVLHMEQSIAVMAQTGLPITECLELILLVDDYVFGYIERFEPILRAVGNDPASVAREHAAELAARIERLDSATFPHVRELFSAETPQTSIARFIALAIDPARFDRGLDIVLDGIERRVSRRSLPSAVRGRRKAGRKGQGARGREP
jgi:AcrR family transcriptional regulator